MFPVLTAPYRCDVGNPAPTLLLHVRNDQPHQFVAAEQVQIERSGEVFHGRSSYVFTRLRAADVVDQNVDGPESGYGLGVDAGEVTPLAHVCQYRHGLGAEGF